MASPTDQLLGTLAVRHGFVSEAEVQALLRELPAGRSLGQLLRDRGLVPESALPSLQRELSLARFLRAERGFAHLCVERGILTSEAAQVLLQEQTNTGNTYRLGERLVGEGRLERSTLDALLKELFSRLATGNAPANSEPTASTIIRAARSAGPSSGVMRAVDEAALEAAPPPPPPPMPTLGSRSRPAEPGPAPPPAPPLAQAPGGTRRLTPAPADTGDPLDGTIVLNSAQLPYPTPAAKGGADAMDGTIVLNSAQLPYPTPAAKGGADALDGTIVLNSARLPYPAPSPEDNPAPIIDRTPAAPDITFDYEGGETPAPNPSPPVAPGLELTTPSPDMTFDYEGDAGGQGTLKLDAPPAFGDPNSRTVPIPSPFAQDHALTAPIPNPFAPGAGRAPAFDPGGATITNLGDPPPARAPAFDPGGATITNLGDPPPARAPAFDPGGATITNLGDPPPGRAPAFDPGGATITNLGDPPPAPASAFDAGGATILNLSDPAPVFGSSFDAGGATMPIRRGGSGGGQAPSALNETMADATSDLTGTLLNNRYQILSRIGQGGMGQVFRADHTLMDRTVAIKVLNPNLVTSESSVARFKREIMTLAQFEHPNVVRLFDAGTTPSGRFYMAMEFVEGQTLARVLAVEGRLTLKRFAHLFAQILQGVAKAHERGIVHRDLKSENLLVTSPSGDAEVIKIMDFGIAKLLNNEPLQSSDAFLTTERVAVGTPEYMSPEQAGGGSDVDHRSDLYSLGVVAFELLTGRLPFEAESPVGYIGKHIVDPPFTFEEAQPGLGHPSAIERFVLKALEKEATARYQSAEEMLDALEVALPRDLQDQLRRSRSSGSSLPLPPPPPVAARAAPASGSASSSRGDALMTKLLRLGVGLAALLTIGIGAALAFKTITRGRPATEVLAETSWEDDYSAGRFKEALTQLKAAQDEVRSEDEPELAALLARVEKGQELGASLSKAQTRWKAALVHLDSAIELGIHAPAKTSLEEAGVAREALSSARAGLRAEGLGEVAGPEPEALTSRSQAVSLLLELRTASGLIVQGVHRAAISKLEAILSKTPPQSPVHAKARRLKAEAAARELLAKVESELAKSAERRYEQARRQIGQAEKLARQESLTDVLERTRALRLKLDEAQEGDALARARQRAQDALARGQSARSGREYSKAISAFEEAQSLAKKSGLTELAAKAEAQIKRSERESASLTARASLGELDAEGPLAALKAGIKARQDYLAAHPRGIEADEIRAALPKQIARLTAREAQAKTAAFDDLSRRAKEAADKGDQRSAAELAAQALELGRANGFETAELEAVAKKAKQGLRKNLLAAKLQDFVKVGEVYVCRFEVSNNEYLRFVYLQRKAGLSFEPLWPTHWEAKGEQGLRFYPEGRGLHPVGGISHAKAVAYCAWRTKEWAEDVPGVKVRLPTREEWEAAARGGTQRAYPWGEEWSPDRVIFKRTDEEGSATSRGEAAETLAGETPTTKLLHMAGNVAEWTSTPGEDDDGATDRSSRILKGGSYRSFRKELLRIDANEQGRTQNSELHWGFRVVVEFE